jgi:hypothetical protein
MVSAPPGAPPGASTPSFGGNRCGWCGGSLYYTQATGQPQQEDHQPGCKFFGRAVQVMQYVKELEQASAGGGRYLRKSIKELSTAARAGNPIHAITILAKKYGVDAKKSNKQAAVAEMLSRACQALIEGEKPPPITVATE